MGYEVTATKKRPKVFDELVGQEFVVSTLKNSLRSGRMAHAYLFAGPRGVGKTSAARILSKALNCADGPTPTPCGDCSSCREIAQGNALDVFEIDGASNTSVNDIRQIKDEVLFAPNSSRYKIYIIDEVHMLSNSAFNALLKTIEEPPPYIVFMFATTEVHKVPATIRSRCQQFNFRLIPVETIAGRLRAICDDEGITAEDEALLWIARDATGSLRDAYTLFDQVVSFSEGAITLAQIREKLGLVGLEQLNELAEILAEGKSGDAVLFLDRILMSGVSVEQFIVDLIEYFRNILFILQGVEKESVLGCGKQRFSTKVLETLTESQVEHALSLLLQLYRNIRYTVNERYELELVISRLAVLSRYLSPEEMFRAIEALRRELPGGGSLSEPRAAESPETDSLDRESLIRIIGKTKMALAALMKKAPGWDYSAGTLRITFENDAFAASRVRDEAVFLSATASELAGHKVVVTVENRGGEVKEEALDPAVDMVKKVFRGEIIQGKDTP
ncbi:MAG: DNA polymerase III subunit gamma/tau [Spirochaetales bacterium]|nr:DNA polymerase III subunit gamma/tau [Spirochaetales bacterium]